ncbi:hypothetical protein FXO38_05378 [Capsicum annuum]|nr:hypothetical protein FXO38_05378 [Capsicum annuum]
MKLSYQPPIQRKWNKVVKLTMEDIQKADNHWSATLIRYVLGDTPYEKSMDNYVIVVWNSVKKPQILYHVDWYYISQFASNEDKEEVLQDGNTYHNKPFILK